MNYGKLLATALVLSTLGAPLRAQSEFTAGDLLLYRVGNGTASLSNVAAPVFLDEYTTAGVLVESIALPTSGANATTASGTASSEGLITLSADGQYLAFTGYNSAVGTAGSVASSTAASVQRVAGTVSYNGTLNIDLLGTSAFSGNNIRGAYTSDGTSIWATGAGSGVNGVWYTAGAGATQLATGGLRAIDAFGGQLYIDSGSTIQSVGTGLPTSGSPSLSTLTSTSGTTSGFVMLDVGSSVAGLDTLYVANNAANTTAIEKFTLASGTPTTGVWVGSGTASIGNLGTSSVGAFGLTGYVDDSGNVVLYGTNSGTGASGTLFTLTDTSGYGGTLFGTASLVANAPANEAWRGVAFVPTLLTVPEPSTSALVAGLAVFGLVGWRRKKR